MNCIICQVELKNLESYGNQPVGGTEFVTYGHYGSTVSDFMDGTGLAVNICDKCLLAAKERELILRIYPQEPPPRPRPKYLVWRN